MPDRDETKAGRPAQAATPRRKPPQRRSHSDELGPKEYLGGTVQSMAAEKSRASTTPEASEVLLRCIRSVKTLGGSVKGNVVRIPAQHAGTAAVDWLARHGYRVLWI